MSYVNNNGVQGCKPYYQPPREQDLINNKLPIEIFHKVLSYLDNKEKQVICLVNHLWKRASIDTAKLDHLSIIKTFANFIRNNFQYNYHNLHKSYILELCNNTEILNVKSLLQVKAAIHDLRETIAHKLKVLPGIELNNLKMTNPTLFKNIFGLAEIFKTFDEIDQGPGRYKKKIYLYLTEIYVMAVEEGFEDKAIVAATKIWVGSARDHVLSSLSDTLMSKGLYDKARIAASRIDNAFTSTKLLYKIALEFTRRGFVHHGDFIVKT